MTREDALTGKGFYTATEAARLSKVPRSTVDYWARTELIVPSQRRSRPRLYSFEDLRDLVVAHKLREQGAGVRDQRAALDYVREVDDIKRLAQANFRVYEGQLVHVRQDDERPVAPHKRGQFFLSMREVFETLGSSDGTPVASLRPADRISIDPDVRGGTPVIEGTRVPAELVAALVGDDMTYDEIIRQYPMLSAQDIQAACDWASEKAGTANKKRKAG